MPLFHVEQVPGDHVTNETILEILGINGDQVNDEYVKTFACLIYLSPSLTPPSTLLPSLFPLLQEFSRSMSLSPLSLLAHSDSWPFSTFSWSTCWHRSSAASERTCFVLLEQQQQQSACFPCCSYMNYYDHGLLLYITSGHYTYIIMSYYIWTPKIFVPPL